MQSGARDPQDPCQCVWAWVVGPAVQLMEQIIELPVRTASRWYVGLGSGLPISGSGSADMRVVGLRRCTKRAPDGQTKAVPRAGCPLLRSRQRRPQNKLVSGRKGLDAFGR